MDAPRHAVYAAIDIGSNTVHLLVARSDGHSVEPIHDTSKLVGLGVDLEQSGALGPRRLSAAAATTRSHVERARAAGAGRVLVLATQAVRAATNRAEAVAVIEQACGVPVLVLEPDREAALAVLAVGLHHAGAEPHLVVDVGGASTQIVVVQGDEARAFRSAAVGTGRLGVYLAHDPPTRDEIATVQQRIGVAVAPAVAALLADQGQPAGAVVTGGASKRLARLFATDPPTRLTLDALLGGFASLLGQAAPVVAERGGIKVNRVSMARVGALILADVLRAAHLVDCIVSPYGIREGAILEAARATP